MRLQALLLIVDREPDLLRKAAKIGANTTLLPGVEVGELALIGAGSVVRARKIPPRSVWAGNPAVKLKDELTELDCFVHIYPHAYAWLEEKAPR